jgi:hypothetical protein
MTQQISGGDTVIIKNGSYKIGYAAGVYDSGWCNEAWTYNCWIDDLPSGADADNRTKIYGEDWNAGCSTKPVLWGMGRLNRMVSLDASSFIDMRCLDITDHDDCGIGSGVPNSCPSSSPYKDYLHARVGVYGYNGTGNTFIDMDVHGLSSRGFQLGKQTDLTMTDVNIIGNGGAGIDQDTSEVDDSWDGDNVFTRVKVNWSGCAENYPVDGGYNNCVDQNNGGYGDGWGSPNGGTGGDFTFVDGEFKYNTSDALDLLYIDDITATTTVERMRFEGNVGNDIKTGAGDVIIRNNLLIGNCDYFDHVASKGSGFTNCRAGGNTIVANMADTNNMHIINNSIVGLCDILIAMGSCDGGETIYVKNNALQGAFYTVDNASWYYGYGGCAEAAPVATATHNIIYDVKEASPCDGYSNCWETDPNFTTVLFTPDVFDLHINIPTDAKDNGLDSGTTVGNTTVPSIDFEGKSRETNAVDLGAYEHVGTPSTPITPPWIDPLPPDPLERVSGVPLTHRHLIMRRMQ